MIRNTTSYRSVLMLAVVGGAATVALAQPTAATADVAMERAAAGCALTALPVPAGAANSTVTAGDPTGRYLLGSARTPVDGVASHTTLAWVNGRLSDLGLPKGWNTPADINQSGTAVGSASIAGRTQAYTYRAGALTVLPGLRPGDSTVATEINRRGDVVGRSDDLSTGSIALVVWPSDAPGTVRELKVPAGRPTAVNSLKIDEDGTVLGFQFTSAYETFVWAPDGTVRHLLSPSGSTSVVAMSIRNGWLSGHDVSGDTPVPLRWNLRTGGIDRMGAAGAYESAGVVNARGDLVLTDGPSRSTAIGHGPERTVVLPTFEGGSAGTVRVLTDRGVAAGSAYDPTFAAKSPADRNRAVVWQGC